LLRTEFIPLIVMPGLDPGIHAFLVATRKPVDGPIKSGHDETRSIFDLSAGCPSEELMAERSEAVRRGAGGRR